MIKDELEPEFEEELEAQNRIDEIKRRANRLKKQDKSKAVKKRLQIYADKTMQDVKEFEELGAIGITDLSLSDENHARLHEIHAETNAEKSKQRQIKEKDCKDKAEYKKEYSKTYSTKNKDSISAAKKAWYEKNKDRIAAVKKAWYEKNKDTIRAARRDQYRKKKKEQKEQNNAQ